MDSPLVPDDAARDKLKALVEQAQRLVEAAREEAARIIEEARAETKKRAEELLAQAEELRRVAEREADEILRRARAEAEALVAAARSGSEVATMGPLGRSEGECSAGATPEQRTRRSDLPWSIRSRVASDDPDAAKSARAFPPPT